MYQRVQGDALDLITAFDDLLDLVVTDPPYAFGGSGDEHQISATVAVVLRECAVRLRPGAWMLSFCASSWRSIAYVVEATRGVAQPVRIGTWTKPKARTRVKTAGWSWASVSVVALRRGPKNHGLCDPSELLDHVEAEPILNGRRAELPPVVADWAVRPFAAPGGVFLDPFCGSGALPLAAARVGMRATGFDKNPS